MALADKITDPATKTRSKTGSPPVVFFESESLPGPEFGPPTPFPLSVVSEPVRTPMAGQPGGAVIHSSLERNFETRQESEI
jgi:hypothetical protein